MSQFLQLLNEVSRSLSELIELDRLVPLVIRKTKELLRADGCAVLLLDEERQELFFPYTAEAAPEVDRRLADIRVPVARGVAGWVVRHGEAQLVPDAQQDERWYAEVDKQTGMDTRCLLTAPLATRHGTVGVIQLRSARVAAFSADDLSLLEELAPIIGTALDNARRFQEVKQSEIGLRDQVALLHREVARSSRFSEIVGTSKAMERIFRLIEGAITAPVTVMLRGETGTGKELIARAIHFNGQRHDRPFVAVNCGALSEQLLESELFGHRRGSFTGAMEDRKGFFEVASGGTIFLDEVGEMTPAMQVKLLRVLQTGEVLRVGETTARDVDVRVISATNSDLEAEIERSRFRRDLYYRLNTFPIPVPPLRDRREDLPLLVAHFLRHITERFDKPVAGLSRDALDAFMTYNWPGNVRELQNELERAVVLTPAGQAIGATELSAHIAGASQAGLAEQPGVSLPAMEPKGPAPSESASPSHDAADVIAGGKATGPLRQARAAFEARFIAAALREHGGNVSSTARALGLSRGVLREKLKEYGLR